MTERHTHFVLRKHFPSVREEAARALAGQGINIGAPEIGVAKMLARKSSATMSACLTSTVCNGSVSGSMMSTPIINPPQSQSAILGPHATKDRPVAENGQVVVRPMNYLALSHDHCIIDGREAVFGPVAMKEALEDPARLVLDI